MAGLTFKDWNSRMDLFVDRQDIDDDDEEEEEEEEDDDEDEDSVWTPAYGFPYSTEENLFLASTTLSDTDGADESSGANSSSTFVVLETIFEENSDDLQSTDSEVDCSYKSDDSSDEDDFESVIHISPGTSSDSGSESERDVAVPKKRRKREAPPVPPRARVPSPEPALLSEPPQSLSRSSSLLQFECLEQALSQEELLEEHPVLVFRTSASDKPFSSADSQPPSFSSFSFDSLDTNGSRRRCSSPLKDSLEEEEASTSSTAGCSSSSDDESYFLDRRHKLSGGSSFGRSRMRSYRSFDSLLHVVRPGRTTLSCVGLDEEEETDETLSKPKKSSENLSEDSGFGDVRQIDTTALPTAATAVEQEEDEVKAAEHMDKQEATDAPAAAREQDADQQQVASLEPPITHPAVGEAVAELNLEEFEGGREAAGTADDQHDGHTHGGAPAVQEEEPVRAADHHCWAAEPRLTLVQFNSDLSIDQEDEPDTVPSQEPDRLFYCSAPNLLSEKTMSVVPVREPAVVPAWDMPPPREITEEVLKRDGDESPKTSKSNRFGSFFQRFSFRKSKGKNKSPQKQSQEDVTTAEAIHSVEQAAAELSNLEEQLGGGGCKKERPPLPPVGPPKSRLLGIVGRRRPEAAAPGELGTKQKIDSAFGSNGGGDETPARAAAAAGPGKKASSLVNITTMNIVDIDISEPAPQGHHLSLSVARPPAAAANDPRAKSMEFLLDDENKAAIQPPENELRKTNERKLSEHELRVQRSLQRLDVPEWYKNSPAAPTGSFLLNRRSSAGTSNSNSKWPGLNSKTTSLSSLQQSPHLRTRHQPPTATSPSPVVSPSPQERLSFNYAPFSRWSTSRLNSASTSPSGSTRSSFHYRQPYLGWRSQEKLLANTTPSYYRTPAERLAASTAKPPLPPPAFSIQPPHAAGATTTQPNNAEVRSSIKEVTSAIVHYVNEKNLSPARPGRSPSPRGSKTRLWVESSFVGSRPIDQPETPSMPDETPTQQPERMQTGGVIINHANGRLSNAEDEEEQPPEAAKVVITPSPEVRAPLPSLPNKTTSKYQQYININFNIESSACEDNASDVSDVELEPLLGPPGKPKLQDELKELLENFGNSRASPPSATIEDVLDSLLGLPTASRSPSPVISPGNSMTLLNSAGRHRDQSDAADQGSANEVGGFAVPGGGTIRRHSSGTIHRSGGALEKTRRVSFDMDPVTMSTPREVSLDSTPAGGATLDENMVRCRYSKCGKVATLVEARRSFKTCHNCNAQVYCSRECRRAHWEKGHRKTCLHGRIGALCRRVANACKEHQPSLELLSKLARRGYLSHGRGCVKVFFSSPELAERFAAAVAAGSAAAEPLLPGEPCFVRWSDLLPTEMGNEQYKELLRLCKGYNPDTRFVVYVATCVVSEVPSSGAVKWERQVITRCAKVRLHRNHTAHAQQQQQQLQQQQQHSSPPAHEQEAITRDLDNPETLILTPLSLSQQEATQRRELVAANIQRQLKQRGVSLRKQFPDVYRKLGAYVETSEPFTPTTIYPRDSASGRTFMCIIMPVADPARLQDVPTDSSRVRTIDVGIEPGAE